MRNYYLDLLRGLAIFLVIIHHLALPFRLPLNTSLLRDYLPQRFLNGLSYNGYEAVFVFFVISGYLICARILQQYGSLQALQLRQVYMQRFSRIFPMLSLLLLLLSALHFTGWSDYRVAEHGQTLPRAVLAALGLHLNWYEAQTSWLPPAWDVLWSLSIEECFYLAFPLLCLYLPRKVLIPALLVLAFSLPYTRAALTGNEIWQEKAYLPGMSAIAFGVLCAIAMQGRQLSRTATLLAALTGSCGLLAVFFWSRELWKITHHHMMLVLCLSTMLLIVAAISAKPRNTLPGLNWLAKMGRLSYELYLSHMLIVMPVFHLYHYLLADDARWHFLAYPPMLISCFFLADWLERKFSLPARRYLLQHWPSGFNSKHAVSQTVESGPT